jgi:nucleoside-diphosphate-sugar epimerase
MEKKLILVTGSSGFLGSAVCVDLSRDHDIIAMDCRKPSKALQRLARGVQWQSTDISDLAGVKAFFERLAKGSRPIDVVLHMAAFYHFGQHWRPEYERVNIAGLANILEGAIRAGTRRFLFASSIASLPPPAAGCALTEKSAPGKATAYTRSKTIGETLLAKYSQEIPTVALRIAGVFSDWCELPPLYSLMKMWSKPHLVGQLIPGCGQSGFPYIHRRDLTQCVRQIILCHERLSPCETLFASPPGCTTHNELFRVIRRACGAFLEAEPIYISPFLAEALLFAKNRVKALLGRKRYERRWMMDYVDTPLLVDTTYTQQKLQWTPGPELSILNRMPVLMQRFHQSRAAWELRNIRRNEGCYAYEDDGE